MYVYEGPPTFDSSPIITNRIFNVRFNESKELSARYLKFNLQSLLGAAVNAVGNGATSCTIRFPACVCSCVN